MKQQTAVEWLVEQIWPSGEPTLSQKVLIEQARQMEKEQIIRAREVGIVDGYGDYIDVQQGTESTLKSGEQYYSETYETPIQ